jgi:hypothetical protein
MILSAQRLSNKAFTFDGSVATIHNYLDQFANQGSLFEYQGYPTSNLREYNPGPFPYMYILKFSWLIHSRYDINPIYLSNLLFILYPAILILAAVLILYFSDLKILAIVTASFTLFLSYLNPNFYGVRPGTTIFDWGFEFITLLSALTLLMVILSYKKAGSSHTPLLIYAGLLFHSHFIALSLAPFAILYALYMIFLLIKDKKYIANYFLLVPIFVIIYLPIIFRFLTDPLYLYRAVKINKPSFKHTQASGFTEEMEYFYKTTPLGLDKDICGSRQNNDCLSFDIVKIYLAFLMVFIFFITFMLLKRSNLFIKILIISSLLLININTINGYDTHHSSVATGLSIAGSIYYISKFNKLVILLLIATIISVNFGERDFNNISKENFSSDWIKSIKNHKFKVDICELSEVGICTNDVYRRDAMNNPSFFDIYGGDNHAQVTIIELLKNNIDICLYNDNLDLDRLEKLRCEKREELEDNRHEIFFISSRQNMAPNILEGFHKIGELIDRRVENCIMSKFISIEESFSKSSQLSSCYAQYGFNITNESTALYLSKDSKDINMAELLNMSNLHIEKVLLQIEQNTKGGAVLQMRCINYKTKVCINEDDLFISVNQYFYQNKEELYDVR